MSGCDSLYSWLLVPLFFGSSTISLPGILFNPFLMNSTTLVGLPLFASPVPATNVGSWYSSNPSTFASSRVYPFNGWANVHQHLPGLFLGLLFLDGLFGSFATTSFRLFVFGRPRLALGVPFRGTGSPVVTRTVTDWTRHGEDLEDKNWLTRKAMPCRLRLTRWNFY